MAETELLQPNPDGEGVMDGISGEYIDAVRDALEEDNKPRITELIDDLHPSDIAEVLSVITYAERVALVENIATDFEAETLTYLDEDVRIEVMEALGTQRAAQAITELETDDAVQVIEDLEKADQQELLDAIPQEYRADLEEGLAYPEDSAGRLMQKRYVALPEFWRVGDVLDYLRNTEELPEDFYEIMVVDPRYRPVGTVMTSRIMQRRRDVTLKELMDDDLHPITIEMDQEEAAHLFRRYGLVEAPVVNNEGRLVGVITIDDIVDVITEEEEEDYLRAGGVIDRDLNASLYETVKKRFPWLLVNLATAGMAAWVISQFESTIQQWVTLAVLMPVIASMSGNAGIQSVTVSVRSISHARTAAP